MSAVEWQQYYAAQAHYASSYPAAQTYGSAPPTAPAPAAPEARPPLPQDAPPPPPPDPADATAGVPPPLPASNGTTAAPDPPSVLSVDASTDYANAESAAAWAAYEQQQQQQAYYAAYQQQHWGAYQPYAYQHGYMQSYAPPPAIRPPQPPTHQHPQSAQRHQPQHEPQQQKQPHQLQHEPYSQNQQQQPHEQQLQSPQPALQQFLQLEKKALLQPAAMPAPKSTPINGSIAPWQKASAKVATAMAMSSFAKTHNTAAAAKSFTIPKSGHKFKVGAAAAGAAVAAVDAPAYVQIKEKPAAAAPEGGQTSFPPAMRAYVERAFLSAKTTEQKKRLHPALKKVIAAASAKGEMWMTNWDSLPLPALTEGGDPAAAAIGSMQAEATAARLAASAIDNRWGHDSKPHAETWQSPPGVLSTKLPDIPAPAGDWQDFKARQRKRQKAEGNRNRYMRSISPSSSHSNSRSRSRSLSRSRSRSRSVDRSWHENPASWRRHGSAGRKGGRSRGGGYDPVGGRASNKALGLASGRLSDPQKAARAERFGSGRADDVAEATLSRNGQRRPTRQQVMAQSKDDTAEEIDLSQFTIKGTCRRLEKSYFRLTAAPDPSSVRPEPVLLAALERLLDLTRGGGQKYLYLLDQFKAMRQDLTVQHLRGQLTVRIYEAHARAALEHSDPSEYNQCQTQLNALAAEGVEGASSPEFLAYRVLYQTVHAREGETSSLLAALRLVTPELSSHTEVRHALLVRRAVYTDDFATFFRLYAGAPLMGRALMDMLVARTRYKALKTLTRAYKPAVPVSFLATLLGFAARAPSLTSTDKVTTSNGDASQAQSCPPVEVLPGCTAAVFPGRNQPQGDTETGQEACVAWLQAHGAEVTLLPSGLAQVDCKASARQLHAVQEAKISHGDENLALSDFLSKISAECL